MPEAAEMTDIVTIEGDESKTGQENLDPDQSLIDALSDDDESPKNIDGDEDAPPEPMFTVKIDGKEIEVSQSDLINGYQAQKVSTERFEEAARNRREADTIRQEAENQRQQYLQHQQIMAQAIQHLQQQAEWFGDGGVDMDALLKENPQEFLRQKELQGKKQEALRQAQAAQQYLFEQQQQQEAINLQNHLRIEGDKLVNELIPEWKDSKKRSNEEQQLVEYLTDQGYSNEDIMGLNHSRASNIALARKAMLYDKLIEKSKQAKKPLQRGQQQPVPNLQGKAASSGKKSITDADLPYDDFVKLRREQIKHR